VTRCLEEGHSAASNLWDIRLNVVVMGHESRMVVAVAEGVLLDDRSVLDESTPCRVDHERTGLC
jgi:hypothetical protein